MKCSYSCTSLSCIVVIHGHYMTMFPHRKSSSEPRSAWITPAESIHLIIPSEFDGATERSRSPRERSGLNTPTSQMSEWWFDEYPDPWVESPAHTPEEGRSEIMDMVPNTPREDAATPVPMTPPELLAGLGGTLPGTPPDTPPMTPPPPSTPESQ